ncbi:MAG TPA: ABC transporter ATP-binding protein [Longimicrobiales bacterium]|nr:ABC transporter ATP-binding protein [Longimicrobiales bacterium]
MAPDAGPLVQAREARKRYAPGVASSGRGALAGVTLSAGPGVTAILGPNGAGKTTLLSLCLGFLRPTSGVVAVAGMAPAAWVRRNGAGYVPERFAPPGSWRPGSVLRDLARLSGARNPRASARAEIERFGLEALAAAPADRLSRGELQRLALAQAAVGDPFLLVLDEPEQGLDGAGRASLLRWLNDRRREGTTILLATHDASLAGQLADFIVVLSRGAILETLAAADDDRDATSYVVGLERPHEALGAWAGSPGAVRQATVRVSGSDDLQARLRALADAGARVVRLRPAGTVLEDRLRRALGEASSPPPGPEGAW